LPLSLGVAVWAIGSPFAGDKMENQVIWAGACAVGASLLSWLLGGSRSGRAPRAGRPA
jgi:hypothetical protein